MRSARLAPLLVVALGLLLNSVPLCAEVVAVNAEVFNRYSREPLPDGTFTPEYYSFGEGGRWSRASALGEGPPHERRSARAACEP